MTPTAHAHIVVREDGKLVIDDTNFKVILLIEEYLAQGSSPEQLQDNHPQLSMGQVLSVLAYYWDNREAIDEQVRLDDEEVEQLRRETPEPPGLERLRRLRAERMG